MNALTTINPSAVLSAQQIKLVKNTVAKDTNDQEFDLFMEVARSMGLNPFRGQILPMVFGKGNRDQSKRKMSIIISRDGLRVIASRCRNYRPASEPAEFTYDAALKGPQNPKGIVSVRVKLWQQDNAGTWWPVIGEADWDEFAPLSYPASAYDKVATGETWPDGNPKFDKTLKEGAVQTLDVSSNWFKMPKVMITKCAEAQALRAGWPEQFGGVYVEEEMHRAEALDLMATEILNQEELKRREAFVNNVPSLMVCFNAQTAALESVPVGEFVDRCLAWIRGCDAETVNSFMVRNRQPLREFWAKHPGDALHLKAKLEEAVRRPAIVEAAE